MFTILEKVWIIEHRTKFNFYGETRSVRVFVVEFLYGILSMFQLRRLFPFAFFSGISAPVDEVFEFSTVFSGIYDLLNLMFFFLFDDSRRRRFRLFLRRECAFVIGCQQRFVEDGVNSFPR